MTGGGVEGKAGARELGAADAVNMVGRLWRATAASERAEEGDEGEGRRI